MPETPHKLRILHADDDESFRLLVRRTIDRTPNLAGRCDLRLVDDGTEAVGYLRGEGEYADRGAHPMPHLVLLDQRMTRMDGIEALREIRTVPKAAHIPVFLLSTSDEPGLANACNAVPGAFCVRKPLEFSRFAPLYTLIVDFASTVLELPARESA